MSVTSQFEISQHEFTYPTVQALGPELAWRKTDTSPVIIVAAGKTALGSDVLLNDGRDTGPLVAAEDPAVPSNVFQLRAERPDRAA